MIVLVNARRAVFVSEWQITDGATAAEVRAWISSLWKRLKLQSTWLIFNRYWINRFHSHGYDEWHWYNLSNRAILENTLSILFYDRKNGQEIIGIQVSSGSSHNVKSNLDASFLSASIISMPIRSQTKINLDFWILILGCTNICALYADRKVTPPFIMSTPSSL